MIDSTKKQYCKHLQKVINALKQEEIDYTSLDDCEDLIICEKCKQILRISEGVISDFEED